MKPLYDQMKQQHVYVHKNHSYLLNMDVVSQMLLCFDANLCFVLSYSTFLFLLNYPALFANKKKNPTNDTSALSQFQLDKVTEP